MEKYSKKSSITRQNYSRHDGEKATFKKVFFVKPTPIYTLIGWDHARVKFQSSENWFRFLLGFVLVSAGNLFTCEWKNNNRKTTERHRRARKSVRGKTNDFLEKDGRELFSSLIWINWAGDLIDNFAHRNERTQSNWLRLAHFMRCN